MTIEPALPSGRPPFCDVAVTTATAATPTGHTRSGSSTTEK